MNKRLFIATVLLLALGSFGAQAESDIGKIQLSDCAPPGVPGGARCGTLSVFEDRAANAGRKISINVLVLPAKSEGAHPDPLFFLHGGPGGAATAMAPLFAHSPVRETRDIVLVDQRGTGASNPLNCPREPFAQSLKAIASFVIDAEACLKQLDGDPRHYLTWAAMRDLDDVRAALGYETINLLGGSYGTRAALEYMRRFPERTRTAVLRGVAGTSFDLPLGFARSSQAALDDALGDCEADSACSKAYPGVRKQLQQVLRKLDTEPIEVGLEEPGSGKKTTLTVDREMFALAVHYSLYNALTAGRVPSFIDQADEGEARPMIDSVLAFVAAVAPQLSDGMFLSVVCSEDVPFYTPEAAARRAEGTLIGDVMARRLKASCSQWPKGTLPEDYRDPVRSDVPVLLISGEADPVTPPWEADRVARHLSRSLHIVLDGTGHSQLAPGCVGGLMQSFLDSGELTGLDISCAREIVRPPFAVSQ